MNPPFFFSLTLAPDPCTSPFDLLLLDALRFEVEADLICGDAVTFDRCTNVARLSFPPTLSNPKRDSQYPNNPNGQSPPPHRRSSGSRAPRPRAARAPSLPTPPNHPPSQPRSKSVV